MVLKKIHELIILSIISISSNCYAAMCTSQSCDGYTLPDSTMKFIDQGYSEIKISSLLNEKYLFLTSENDVNKCSILFRVSVNGIDELPVAGEGRNLCNMSIINNKIVSSWRDQGKWNDDVYEVNQNGKWSLIFNDSCIGCSQIKRTFFKNGNVNHSILLADGDDFLSRKELTGKIEIKKSFLYKGPRKKEKSKAYLIKGDIFSLIDMSDNGEFYKINYKSSSGKNIIYWIRTDDFSFQ